MCMWSTEKPLNVEFHNREIGGVGGASAPHSKKLGAQPPQNLSPDTLHYLLVYSQVAPEML